MNNINIKGNLVKDAELKYIGSKNTPCANFVIAHNKTFKNERGNIEKEVSFFDVVVFGKYAETLHSSLVKGALCFVSGRLNQERWEKDGKNYARISIIANQLSIIQPRNQPKESTPPNQTNQNTSNAASQDNFTQEELNQYAKQEAQTNTTSNAQEVEIIPI